MVDEAAAGLAASDEMGILCPSPLIPGSTMNENAVQLKDLIRGAGLTREGAAEKLYVSVDTLHKWLKPATTANRNPCPRWAVELLAYKTQQKIPPMPGEGGKSESEAAAEPAPAPKAAPKPVRQRKAASKPASPSKVAKAPAKKRAKAK